ncbi:MAG: hypothetical protein CL927_11260 [Deltaproteobacteria bacterium]|nr:hypothetical protein [Deltaproteobacteria bacterium]HCH63066.1 hypothetical protein [Deltaproteobacteria bacterium]
MRHGTAIFGLLTACAPAIDFEAAQSECVPTLPDPTRSRAKQVICSDELGDGDAERGDWLLQSDLLTVYIRAERTSLTRAGRAGGTLVDLSAADVAEIVPLLPTTDSALDWFIDVDIAPIEDDFGAGIRVSGTHTDGSEAEITWWLDHGGDRLDVWGADTFSIAPLANTTIRGDLLQYGDRLVGSGVLLEDTGGRITWTGTSWLKPASATDLPEILPERYVQRIEGSCQDGDVVYLRDETSRIIQRVDLEGEEGIFGFFGDRRALEIACYASGRTSSGWRTLPEWDEVDETPEQIQMSVGDYGQLSVSVTDHQGAPLPTTVWWNARSYSLVQGSGTLYVGAGSGEGLATAGPAYSVADLPQQDVGEDSRTGAVLRRVIPDDALLADFFVESWPHPTTRTSANTQLKRRGALGVEWAITVGDHVVAAADVSQTSRNDLWGTTGARAPTEWGTITSWPWSANARAAQWGAPDTRDLGPHEALALMGAGRSLTTVVDTDWVEAAGPPHTWPVQPDALHLKTLDDLPIYFDLLDQWTSLALVGPRTWLDGVDRRTMAPVDAERALHERRTMATTGPFVRLNVSGEPLDDIRLDRSPRQVHIEVHAPLWMPVDEVAIVGPGGEIIAEWSLGAAIDTQRLDAQVELPDDLPWVVATAWSDRTVPDLQEAPPWTVTSAIVLRRP